MKRTDMAWYSGFLAISGAIMLLCSVVDRSQSQSKTTAQPDIYALMEVVWDMPAGFEAAPKKGKNPGEQSVPGQSNHAYGTKLQPPKVRFDEPTRKEAADVRIWVTASPGLAVEAIMPDNGKTHFNVVPEMGSCSGKKIGDFCAHLIVGGKKPIAAGLWFTVGTVAYYTDLRGPAGERNWPKAVEGLAATLITRYNAVQSLASAPTGTVRVHGKEIAARKPGGVEVARVLEYAEVIGAKSTLDITKSIVEIKSAHHVLALQIGTKAGTLDGKPINFSFPALRDGPDNVVCPVAALRMVE